MKILGVIPARYASTRFPGKPLADIGGKSMIRRVYEQTLKCRALHSVIVATDNNQIYNHVNSFGMALMTDEGHLSGTDRCFEVLSKQSEHFEYIINIQGDEPFIDPEQINLLVSSLQPATEIATLCRKIDDQVELFNVNVVKVLFNKKNEAIYFSRSPLPHMRGIQEDNWISKGRFFKHIGLYAYRADVLKAITALLPSELEKAEALEQLRWIENGYKINVYETQLETISVDTQEDLAKAREFIAVQG